MTRLDPYFQALEFAETSLSDALRELQNAIELADPDRVLDLGVLGAQLISLRGHLQRLIRRHSQPPA